MSDSKQKQQLDTIEKYYWNQEEEIADEDKDLYIVLLRQDKGALKQRIAELEGENRKLLHIIAEIDKEAEGGDVPDYLDGFQQMADAGGRRVYGDNPEPEESPTAPDTPSSRS